LVCPWPEADISKLGAVGIFDESVARGNRWAHRSRVQTGKKAIARKGDEVIARSLLALPSFAVAGVYVAVLLLPDVTEYFPMGSLQDVLESSRAVVALICVVVWAFALFLVAQDELKSAGLIGRAVFSVALLLLVSLIPVAGMLSTNPIGGPVYLLFQSSMIFVTISIAFAVSALLTTEGESGWPLRISFFVGFFSVFFLPIGIWFLRPRVTGLLRNESP
jgi:hypothetical protein